MSSQKPKSVLAELGFTKLAILASSCTTGERVSAILESEKLTGVFLIGDHPRLLEELRELKVSVQVLAAGEWVPSHVFVLEEHHGFWGSVHKESGGIWEVNFAEDNVGAARVLLGHLYPEYRSEYLVHPVSVQLQRPARLM